MDLVVFENDKPYVIDEFREGRFDYLELASDVAETKFFQFLFGQGRPQNITPPAETLGEVRKLTDAYRRFRQARTQLLRLQKQLLTLLDRLEAARVQEGERRFQQLRSPASRTRSRR